MGIPFIMGIQRRFCITNNTISFAQIWKYGCGESRWTILCFVGKNKNKIDNKYLVWNVEMFFSGHLTNNKQSIVSLWELLFTSSFHVNFLVHRMDVISFSWDNNIAYYAFNKSTKSFNSVCYFKAKQTLLFQHKDKPNVQLIVLIYLRFRIDFSYPSVSNCVCERACLYVCTLIYALNECWEMRGH